MHIKDDKERGLYDKFKVFRTDGGSAIGGKHHDCEYFVLDLDHDPYAAACIELYAKLCRDKFPQLASDLEVRAGVSRLKVQESVAMGEVTEWCVPKQGLGDLSSVPLQPGKVLSLDPGYRSSSPADRIIFSACGMTTGDVARVLNGYLAGPRDDDGPYMQQQKDWQLDDTKNYWLHELPDGQMWLYYRHPEQRLQAQLAASLFLAQHGGD